MSKPNRHRAITFHVAEWLATTARMPRLVKAVFFDICLHSWETAEPVPAANLTIMMADLPREQGEQIVDMLVQSESLTRDEAGNVWSEWALTEGRKAFDLYERKAGGGKTRAVQVAAGKPALPQESKGTPAALPAPDEEKPAKPDGEEKPAKARPSAAQCAEVIGAWNEMALEHGLLTRAAKMTDARQAAARTRLEENSIVEIREAIGLVPKRPFLMGTNERGWKADIDFLLRPNSVSAILEGSKYMDRGGKGSAWKDMA